MSAPTVGALLLAASARSTIALHAIGSSVQASVERVVPILVFLGAITIVAELADASGLFSYAARETARLARGRVIALFLLLVVLASVLTILLSLDTTAVLLTPLVLALCAQIGVTPIPFAMATVWLANTASLLLPVSNLTNLLAQRSLHLSVGEYVSHIWLSALAAIVVTTAVLWLLHRRSLRGRFSMPERPHIESRGFFAATLLAVGCFVVLVLVDVSAPVAATVAAAIAALGAVLWSRTSLTWALAPWRLLLFVVGLFAAVGVLNVVVSDLLPPSTSTSLAALFGLSASSAVGANLINNLPAYLVAEPHAATATARMFALLIGVNIGPLVLLWGSLATLLWRERCRARGVIITARTFAWQGLILVPLAMAAALLVLAN